MTGTPLSRLRRLPPALCALTRSGQGDNASARCKPEHGVRWGGLLRGHSFSGLVGVVRRQRVACLSEASTAASVRPLWLQIWSLVCRAVTMVVMR